MNLSDKEPDALEMFHFIQHDKQRAILSSIRLKGVILAALFYLGRLGELFIIGVFLEIQKGEASTTVQQRGPSSNPDASPLLVGY